MPGRTGRICAPIGSGNIGATNLARAVGRPWGYTCFALDVLKGLAPVALVGAIVGVPESPGRLSLWLLVGAAAILGHVFPIYLRFKGGKGVATSFGVALGLWPYFTFCAVIALLVWVVVVQIWHYISLASICAAVAFPIALALGILVLPDWHATNLWPLLIAAVAIPILVIVRHRENHSPTGGRDGEQGAAGERLRECVGEYGAAHFRFVVTPRRRFLGGRKKATCHPVCTGEN